MRKRGFGKKSSVASEQRAGGRARLGAAGLQTRRRSADFGATRRHPGGVAPPPGTDRRRRHRLRQEHPIAPVLPRTGARHGGPHRAYSTAAAGGARPGRADCRGNRPASGRQRRFSSAIRRSGVRRHASGADDRRIVAGRTCGRSTAAALRHHHCRRGARADAECRLADGRAQAAFAAPPGSQGDRDLGDLGCRARFAILRRCPGHYGERPQPSDRGALSRNAGRRGGSRSARGRPRGMSGNRH